MKNGITVDMVSETSLWSKLEAILDFEPFNDIVRFLKIISLYFSPSKTII